MKMVYNEQLNDHICKAQPIEWAVVNVKANDDYTIDITFINGEKRVFDASKLLNKKIYEPLRRLWIEFSKTLRYNIKGKLCHRRTAL